MRMRNALQEFYEDCFPTRIRHFHGVVLGADRRIFRPSELFSVASLQTEIRAIDKTVDVAAVSICERFY